MDFEFPPLTDDELIDNAEAIFLELDQRERQAELDQTSSESNNDWLKSSRRPNSGNAIQ
jgi:hypothetical protein